jgi:general stress protein CsbA
MDNLNALFTMQSLLSLQGSAAAALIVPNVLAYLFGDTFKPYKKWVAFVLAMVLSYLVAILASGVDWTKWILAFFNGFLIFASAVGVNQAASSSTQLGGTPTSPTPSVSFGTRAASGGAESGGTRFFESWF